MAPKKASAPAKEEEEEKKAEDPKKRKADEKAEDAAAPKKEAKKEPGKVQKEDAADAEKERDAPVETRATLKAPVTFIPTDTTLNVVPAAGGKLLMAMTEGGMQYLIAGARASVGVQAGRYAYEVKIVEALNPTESSGQHRGRAPVPRQLVRLGFSTAGSSPLLGSSDDGVYFDSEGFYASAKSKKAAATERFTRDQVITVLLNLDPESANANTVSLFCEGKRISKPQALPEHLLGKPLFPHVAFRGVTVQVLFGPKPAMPLPFTCTMLQGAAQADVTVTAAPKPDAKFDVVFPVGMPDEGTFDWLDGFLEKNPQYVELSDRKIQEWVAASGLAKPRSAGAASSRDKPSFNYGLPSMDDGSIRRVITAMASVVPRHYVVMEVKSNLVAADRQEMLKRFTMPHFRKVAYVAMGEPSEQYKVQQLERLQKEKQEKAEAEWRAKKAEEERKKQIEQRQKQLAEMRKKADEARKKAAEEAKKKREEALKKLEAEKKAKAEAERKAKEGEEAGAEASEEKAEEEAAPMEVEEAKKEDEAKEEEEEKKDEEMEEKEDGPPQVELTEEEKSTWFRSTPPGANGDLTAAVLNQAFASFTIPEKSEGFDDVKFEWQPAKASKDYLHKWVQERKLTSRIDDLQPGKWFQERHAEWLKTYQAWQKKQKEYNTSAAKKAKDEARKEAAKELGEDDDGKEEAVDISTVENVLDVGEGEPLFASFALEDWALLQLRFELYFLAAAFKKDVDDPERLGIREQHLAFYYTKYFRKQLQPKYFGVASNVDLCKLIKDTVVISEDTQVLTTQLAEETETADIFVKLTEENRRERQRRIDAGDETAKLKFNAMAAQQQPQAQKAVPQGALPVGTVGARPAGGAAWAAGPRPGWTPGPTWRK